MTDNHISDRLIKDAFFSDAVCILTEVWGHDHLTSIDSTTEYYFADVEKNREVDSDDNSCWLTSASNIMYWGGWATAGDPTLSSEDAFFEYVNKCWGANNGGHEFIAYNWWIVGQSGFSLFTAPDGGGKFLPAITSASNYYMTTTLSNRGAISSLFSAIEGGCGVTLGIGGNGISHAITCWGYELVSDNIYLYYSDSDDQQIYGDRTAAPNTLHKTRLSYDVDAKHYYLMDYIVSGTYITQVTALEQYDKIFSGLHETFADARKVVASGDGTSQTRRGKLNGANDDDYYEISGEGRGACFSILAWSATCPSFTIDMYDSDHNWIASVANTLSCSGSFTTSENDEKYYIRITGNNAGQFHDLTSNIYAITVQNNHWWTTWSHIPNSSEIIEIVADNTVAETYISDNEKYAKDDYCAAAIIGLGNKGYRKIAGGPSIGAYSGNIRLCANETTVRTLYGGGAAGTMVNGDIYLELGGGVDVSAAFFGGGASSVTGSIYINAESGGGTANFFGGSLNAAVAGSVDFTIVNGTYTGLLIGGGRSGAAGTQASAGNIAVSISGRFVHTPNLKLLANGISSWIVGGGQAAGAGKVTAGNITISVSDGAEANFIVGGGQASGSGSTATTSSVTVSIAGAKVTGNVFGGGYAISDGVSNVSGNVSITIDASTAETTLLGNIYAGGANPRHTTSGGSAIVNGNAMITFTGSSDLLNFSGVVSGDGAVPGSVRGSSTLRFKDFSGEFSGTVKNFSNLTVADSTVMLTGDCSVIGLKYQITAIPEVSMLKIDQLDFETLDIVLDAAMLTRNCAIQLWEGDATTEINNLAAAITDINGTAIGTLTVNDRNKMLAISNGKLGLASNYGRMYLYFTLNA